MSDVSGNMRDALDELVPDTKVWRLISKVWLADALAKRFSPVLPTLVEPTVDELDALPVGTVMRGRDEHGSGLVVEKHYDDGRWAETGWNRPSYTSELVLNNLTWQVLWMPEVESR